MSKLSVDTFRMLESISIGRFQSELKILISAKGKICNNATHAGQVNWKLKFKEANWHHLAHFIWHQQRQSTCWYCPMVTIDCSLADWTWLNFTIKSRPRVRRNVATAKNCSNIVASNGVWLVHQSCSEEMPTSGREESKMAADDSLILEKS